MDLKSTDSHLTWIVLVFNKSSVLEKKLNGQTDEDFSIPVGKNRLKEWVHEKILNQILNFEIRTFYRYIELYRIHFLDTLTFPESYYTA